jgi:hypothetical protein
VRVAPLNLSRHPVFYSWGIGYRHLRRLSLEITELSVKGLDRIKRVAEVPVRVRVASGP